MKKKNNPPSQDAAKNEDAESLKVGELAKRTGMTVRTLHHYDAIGLLKPSARSAAGYRLYNDKDIARLHAVQALRNLGFPLSEIDSMLGMDDAPLPDILLRQMHTLDQEITRAMDLRSRLSMLHERLSAGSKPTTNDWLAALQLMNTHGKYFTADEIKFITASWKLIEGEWQPLIKEVHAAMKENIPVDAPHAQGLARRWMDLSMRWMDNDSDLLFRWKDMLQKEPDIHELNGDDPDLHQYIVDAIELRHVILQKYLSIEDMKRMHKGLEEKWAMLEQAAQEAMRQKLPHQSETVQQLVGQWNNLMDELTDHDPVIRQKFMAALSNEPFLQIGSPLSAEVRAFIRQAAVASGNIKKI